MQKEMKQLLDQLQGSVALEDGALNIINEETLRANIHHVVKTAVLNKNALGFTARYLIRRLAQALDIVPASIHDLYLARGRGDVPNNFTTPAINLRGLPFYAASQIFRIVQEINAGAFIFEIARSEIGYTDQRPSEYTANILGAAIAEGYRGPVFIQGDHFQISDSRYQDNPEAEINAVKDLTTEALQAGFFNIDIDTSTLVDLSYDDVAKQQKVNTSLSAMFTKFIRNIEPADVTVSVGGEIGEVGGHNSTEEELRAYLEGYNAELEDLDPDAIGLSKISIQTGTSHGGVVLPDGSIAEVSVDFDTLQHLGEVSRKDYGLGGAVQHGASTLPEDAFNKFVDAGALEVHLATNFQNMMFDELPQDLVDEIYAYVDEAYAGNRKPDQTDEQFHYKNRKRGLGEFKEAIWNLPEETIMKIAQKWDAQFRNLFDRLSLADTRPYVEEFVTPAEVEPTLEDYFLGDVEPEDTTDLAD
jgi:fructose/tagatose bisphosphate aldolase